MIKPMTRWIRPNVTFKAWKLVRCESFETQETFSLSGLDRTEFETVSKTGRVGLVVGFVIAL